MTGLDRCEPQSPVSTLVARAFSALKTLVDTLEESTTECSAAASHLARLKLWAGSLGAHRPSGTRSLEYRLRDASSIRNHIVSLLQDLCESIDEGVSMTKGNLVASDERRGDTTDIELTDYFQDDGSQGDCEIGQILIDIGHTLDCLLRLCITIQTPAPHDRFRSRAGTDVVELFEQWDTKHVQDKFPAINVRIAERLGRATARRRQYFKYRVEHHAKLAEGLDTDCQNDEDKWRDRATTVASSVPNHLKDPFSQFGDLADDNKSEVSITSYAPSTTDTTKLRVPPMPKEYANGPFKCPFCCMVVSIDTRREWKKHVFRDLQPYVCLASSCPTPENQYSRRSDWISHMKQHHWRSWHCPFECQLTYTTAHEHEEHVKRCHQDETATKSLDALQLLSSHLDLKQAQGRCPLCSDFQIMSDRQYSSHIADHLESLALFALPNTSTEEEGGVYGSKESEDSEADRNQENVHDSHDGLLQSEEDARFNASADKSESKPAQESQSPLDSYVVPPNEEGGEIGPTVYTTGLEPGVLTPLGKEREAIVKQRQMEQLEEQAQVAQAERAGAEQVPAEKERDKSSDDASTGNTVPSKFEAELMTAKTINERWDERWDKFIQSIGHIENVKGMKEMVKTSEEAVAQATLMTQAEDLPRAEAESSVAGELDAEAEAEVASYDAMFSGPLPWSSAAATGQPHWSPETASAQPGQYSGPSAANRPFVCHWEGCTKAYSRQCDLDKHICNHTKARKCDICGVGLAENKNLNRHMWVHHREEARRRGLFETEECQRCGYLGRKDNLKRHKDKMGHW